MDSRYLLELVTPEPGISIPRALANQWEAIRKTARETVKIEAKPNRNLHLRESKFGHFPCLPKNFKYPLDKAGKYMFPLAQINFREVPKLTGFPESGYLQFYVALDDIFGCSFDATVPSDFKVSFFEETDVVEIEEDFSFLESVLKKEYSPVNCPHRLTFQRRREYVGLSDAQGERNQPIDYDAVAKLDDISGHLMEAISKLFYAKGHKLGGYAYFTQVDPREGSDSPIRDYQLLFQMDSIGGYIMWGDVGVANFFIAPEKLAKKDFSEVFYHWDCY